MAFALDLVVLHGQLPIRAILTFVSVVRILATSAVINRWSNDVRVGVGPWEDGKQTVRLWALACSSVGKSDQQLIRCNRDDVVPQILVRETRRGQGPRGSKREVGG